MMAHPNRWLRPAAEFLRDFAPFPADALDLVPDHRRH